MIKPHNHCLHPTAYVACEQCPDEAGVFVGQCHGGVISGFAEFQILGLLASWCQRRMELLEDDSNQGA